MSEPKADPQRAFRAGLGAPEVEGVASGFGLSPASGPGLGEAPAPWGEAPAPRDVGPNEALVLAMRRVPGLVEPRAAFETGRALRIIARLLDEAGAPARVGEQFRDNLVAAVIAHAARREQRPWNAEDTVAMFVELYRRGLGGGAVEPERLEATLLRWTRQELRPLPGTRPRSGPRRPRSLDLAA